jgi:plastocyanin
MDPQFGNHGHELEATAAHLAISAEINLPCGHMSKRVLLTIGLSLLVLTACAGEESEPTAPDGPAVFLRDLAYDPVDITVQAGETVTWVWDDNSTAHDVVGEGFRSELVTSGTFAHTFEEPGTFPYVCSIHPNMVGTVIVEGPG